MGSNQVSDFNPGIRPSGLFWTVPVRENAILTELDDGATPSATLDVADLDVEDYHNLNNALHDGPSVEATVSFRVHWGGSSTPLELHNSQLRFSGTYFVDTASIAWSASEPGFTFTSDPTSHSVFAVIGHERSGVFFG